MARVATRMRRANKTPFSHIFGLGWSTCERGPYFRHNGANTQNMAQGNATKIVSFMHDVSNGSLVSQELERSKKASWHTGRGDILQLLVDIFAPMESKREKAS